MDGRIEATGPAPGLCCGMERAARQTAPVPSRAHEPRGRLAAALAPAASLPPRALPGPREMFGHSLALDLKTSKKLT